MARGTAVGEPVVSRARTKEFDEGYSRVFGDKSPVRGKWIWDDAQKRLVNADSYVPVPKALDAPICAGRFYEGAFAPDANKTDIGSRRKHREYMKRNNVTLASDFSHQWAKQAEERESMRKGDFDHRARKEAIERALYRTHKP